MCLNCRIYIDAYKLYYSLSCIKPAWQIFHTCWVLHVLRLAILHSALKWCLEDEDDMDYVDEDNFMVCDWPSQFYSFRELF
jgi:hypothetical protein